MYLEVLCVNFDSRSFAKSDLENFTRKNAFECKVPKIRTIEILNLVHYKNETEIHRINDPCSDKYIPTMSCLLRWKSELRDTLTAIGKFYCEFWLAGEQCRSNLEAILITQKPPKAGEINQAVEKELTYLFSLRMKPVPVTKEIDYNPLERFIELIHNTPYLSKLGSFDMLPKELARLCGRRYLSDERMS